MIMPYLKLRRRNLASIRPNSARKNNENGQFKRDAEPKDDCQEETGIVFDREDRMKPIPVVDHQYFDSTGQNLTVSEICASQEKSYGGKHKRPHVAFLPRVQPWGDKEPNLKQDERAGQDCTTHK
jgi:hypothetical protein